MKKNIGIFDSIRRGVVAIFLGILFLSGVIDNIEFIVFAIFLFITAVISFCPIYLFFGFNTYQISKKNY